MIQQINAMRSRFKTYAGYGTATFDKAFTKKEIAEATVLKSETFASSYLENLGNGKFKMTPLPLEVQTAPLYGMHVEDVDLDGNLDILLVGNSFAPEVSTGRYDAFKGAILQGDGTGNFNVLSPQESGFRVDTDAKALVRLQTAKMYNLYLVGNNNGPVSIFKKIKQTPETLIPVTEKDVYAMIHFQDGTAQKQEIFFGNSYLSQSINKIPFRQLNTASVEIFNHQNEKRIFKKEDLN